MPDDNSYIFTNCVPKNVRCLFNWLHGCFALCSGRSGEGREVVDGKMGPDWLGLAKGGDITWRRGPVV